MAGNLMLATRLQEFLAATRQEIVQHTPIKPQIVVITLWFLYWSNKKDNVLTDEL